MIFEVHEDNVFTPDMFALISPIFHFQGASCERHNANSVALSRQKSTLQGLDQGLRRLLVKVFVVRGHGSQDREHLKLQKKKKNLVSKQSLNASLLY